MTRKAPSGPKHDRCIGHVEHPYPSKGMLCIGSVIGREGMLAFADELAVSAAQHRAAFLADVEALHVAARPNGRKAAKRSAGGFAHVPELRKQTDVGLAELVARYAAMRGRPEPVFARAPVRKPARPVVERPAPVVAEPIEDAPEPGTWTTTPEGIPVYAPEPVSVEPAAEPSRCRQYLHTTGGMRRCMIEPDLHDGPHDYDRIIRPMMGEPYEMAPEPDTYAAAVELAETRPDPCEACQHSAHGATCLPCDDAAQVGVYAPCQVTQPDAEPSGGAEGEPEPVLSAPAPAERPTCPRCGQSFRVKGTGRDWHVANRPDCARVAVAV